MDALSGQAQGACGRDDHRHLAAYYKRDAFAAQAEYSGKVAMLQMGFDIPMLVQLVGMHEPRRDAVREIGAKLNWRKGSTAPTLTHIAQEVGRKAEYDFIYEGTSRFVHFSPQELYRRVWGNPNELVIGSNTFAKYWGYSQFMEPAHFPRYDHSRPHFNA